MVLCNLLKGKLLLMSVHNLKGTGDLAQGIPRSKLKVVYYEFETARRAAPSMWEHPLICVEYNVYLYSSY